MKQTSVTNDLCFECLQSAAASSKTRAGYVICQPCREAFYVACVRCQTLLPTDEVLSREQTSYCPECFAKPEPEAQAELLSEDELAALLAEFIRLHAEEKQLGKQLEDVKERLKRHAATQPRINNAVLLRAGEAGVKCSFSARASFDAEKLTAAEELLGLEVFATLFAREVKFSPVKDQLEEFLAGEDQNTAVARALIVAATERKETITITPAPAKSGAGRRNTPEQA